ncbi:uncharacterized protein [Temnothorax nylanderi]|uniref:uncharacterized protein n=1 Tax=Temnothorax nylanderi TaxID=102681 RepID=UPI003A8C7075
MEENGENLEEVYVCAVCETIIGSSDIYSHGCFEGYPEVYIKNHYVYPRCEDLSIVRRSDVNGSEEIVTEPLASTSLSNSQLPQHLNTEEQLIHLIHEREPLWNLRSPLEKRSKENKEKLWEEVAAAIGSGNTVAALKKKWKNLCDSYRRFVNSEKGTSGSAAKKKKRWIYSDIMSFMSDVNLQDKSTDSNMQDAMMTESNDSTSSCHNPPLEEVLSTDDEIASSTVPRTRKNTRNSDMEIADKVVQAITNSTPTNIFKFPDISTSSTFDKNSRIIRCCFWNVYSVLA